jgi:tRNA(adenine34) deaminase
MSGSSVTVLRSLLMGLWESLAAPWRWCLAEAWTAYCAGSLPIGAAVTDAEGRLLARGRNRIFEPTAADGRLAGHRLAHAEMNALIALDHAAVDPHACVLYTTTEPCPLCIGAARMYRLRQVRYAARDAAAGSADLVEASPFMRRGAIQIAGPERAELESVITAMHVEWVFNAGEPQRAAWVLEAWERTTPQGVALGKSLAASGELRQLRAAGSQTPTVIDTLAAHLGVS